ncbi:sugar phosphate isomerase/epimerase family protein [Fictibacillus sp. NRS-1165]|uniref:sugar phosphate isomerase/epimerase family protein n=1 Tax=Fictibacillus sp. NRS-1165 TaxID=3144463 RepID=UPI003D20F46B
MQLSLCSTGFKDMPVENVIDLANKLGLDGIELWIQHILDYEQTHGDLDGLLLLLRRHNLHVPVISGYTYFSKNDSERELREMENMMQRAAILKCKLIRTFVGHIPSIQTNLVEWSKTLSSIMEALKLAHEYKMYIGVETHNNTFADSFDSLRLLIKEINDPYLKIIYDGFNFHIDGYDSMEVLREFYPHIFHVHLKNYRWCFEDWDKSVPTSIFEGDFNHLGQIQLLKDQQYSNYLSLEYFGDDARQLIAESLRDLRPIVAS